VQNQVWLKGSVCGEVGVEWTDTRRVSPKQNNKLFLLLGELLTLDNSQCIKDRLHVNKEINSTNNTHTKHMVHCTESHSMASETHNAMPYRHADVTIHLRNDRVSYQLLKK